MAGNDVADLDVGKYLLDDGVRARPPAGPLAPRLALHSYQSFCSFAVLRFLVFVRFKRNAEKCKRQHRLRFHATFVCRTDLKG